MCPRMTHLQWNDTARRFADHMGQYRNLLERGVAPIRFLEEDSMADLADCPVVVGVFGNDRGHGAEAQREIDLLRERLRETDASELGFAISDDAATWALLAGVETSRYATAVGQTLQRELFKTFFEDALRGVWLQVQSEAAEHAVRMASTLGHGS